MVNDEIGMGKGVVRRVVDRSVGPLRKGEGWGDEVALVLVC